MNDGLSQVTVSEWQVPSESIGSDREHRCKHGPGKQLHYGSKTCERGASVVVGKHQDRYPGSELRDGEKKECDLEASKIPDTKNGSQR